MVVPLEVRRWKYRAVIAAAFALIALGNTALAAMPEPAAPPKSKMSAAETRQLALDYVAMMQTHDLGLVREQCVRGSVLKMKADSEARWGKKSFPEPAEYCLAALKRAVEIKEAPVLYVNLALQEQGRREFTFVEDAKLVGNAPATIMRNMLAAADAGQGTYNGADGKERPLTGAQALDIGVTFGSIRPDLVTGLDPSKADRDRITASCNDPQAVRIVIDSKSPPEPIQKACAAIGRKLGQAFRLGNSSAAQ